MITPEKPKPDGEEKYHDYVTNRIPWFVHGMWVLFWIMAIGYILTWLVPALRREILGPP